MARTPPKVRPRSALNQSDKLDPASLDVAGRKRRKLRDLPEPKEELAKLKPTLRKRANARPHPPGIILEPAEFDTEHWASPHSDRDLWELQLADALGTRSMGVIVTFLTQFQKLCSDKHWDDEAQQWRLDEHEWSAILAMVNSVKPENEMQAALAAQMVAVHLMTMRCASRAIRFDYDTATAAVTAKLARTFADQMRTMQELKGQRRSRTVRQSIKVVKETHSHEHVHLHDNRGGGDNSDTFHGPEGVRTIGQLRGNSRAAAIIDQCSTVPGDNAGGEVVPLSSREGPPVLPKTRRKGGGTNG